MDIKIQSNKIFQTANESRKLYVVMLGSAASGKSYETALHYIIRIMRDKGRNLLCVRKAECTHRQSTYTELTAAISRLGVSDCFKCTTNPMKISCRNGNEIIFRGVNSDAELEKIKSVTFQNGVLTDLWIEEATEIQERHLFILTDRMRGELPPHLFFQVRLTFNPVNVNHWIKKAFFDIRRDDAFTHRSTYLDNRFVGEDYKERAKIRERLDSEGYKIYYLGEWGELGGLILTNWEWIDGDMESSINRFGKERYFDGLSYGQDFGFTHNNAIVETGFKDGDLYVLDELVVNNKDSNQIIRMADEKGINKDIVIYCDSAEPDRIQMWRMAGYYAVASDKTQRVKAQIDWLKQRRIFVHPDCVNLGKELSQWRWDKDRVSGAYKEEPLGVNDDCMAALRYSTEPYRKLYPLNQK